MQYLKNHLQIETIKNLFEKQFQEGMTWNNKGYYGWHIDHIIPLYYFNLTDNEQVGRACNYKNLQPLWAADNIRKNNQGI